jgi:hypothetical protein
MAFASPGELLEDVLAIAHEASAFSNRRSDLRATDDLGSVLALVGVDAINTFCREEFLGGVIVPRRGTLWMLMQDEATFLHLIRVQPEDEAQVKTSLHTLLGNHLGVSPKVVDALPCAPGRAYWRANQHKGLLRFE